MVFNYYKIFLTNSLFYDIINLVEIRFLTFYYFLYLN